MQVDYIIVGQGICGTMLSWFLHKEGKTFVVIDDNNENASSKIAAGIINPVTGRRYAYTWMIDDVMPYAVQVYNETGKYLNSQLISEKTIIDFFPSPQMRNAFIERLEENDTYLHSFPDQNHFNQYFNYDFGCGAIQPSYMVNLGELIAKWRNKLSEWNAIINDPFNIEILKLDDEYVQYQDILAQKIIFCDGVSGTLNPWFELLPFAPNKGEAIIIRCEDLMTSFIFKKGMMLAPLPQKDLYWVGSNYQWEFADENPSTQFYEQSKTLLKSWLKKEFEILDHKAAVRPATIERRPFVGFHPINSNIGILNGMGTKGSSLAPFFANQLVQNLVHGLPITPEADVNRFNRILSKSSAQ